MSGFMKNQEITTKFLKGKKGSIHSMKRGKNLQKNRSNLNFQMNFKQNSCLKKPKTKLQTAKK